MTMGALKSFTHCKPFPDRLFCRIARQLTRCVLTQGVICSLCGKMYKITFWIYKTLKTLIKRRTLLETNLIEQSLTVQINNYTLAFGNNSRHALELGKRKLN